jgi:hypothetical protein
MTKNITISIPDELSEKMGVFPEVNWSEICRQGIDKYVDAHTRKERDSTDMLTRDFSWRTDGYKGNRVTVGARLGPDGPTDWSLEIQTDKLDKPLLVELGGMTQLDSKIRGVADYFNHSHLKKRGVDMSKVLSSDMLSDLWLGIARFARKNKLDFFANIALLPPEKTRVRGSCAGREFNDAVIPKPWEDVRKDNDEINVFFSNFWIGSYQNTNGTIFRLSSYLAEEYRVLSAKSASRFVDFDPDREEDQQEIRKLFDRAAVIYLPDLELNQVRSIFFTQNTK